MKIYAIHNGTGSKQYRLIPQLKAFQERGDEVILEKHDDKNMIEHIDWADIVIFQMVLSLEWIKYAKSKGKKVIFECDDLIHIVPKTHYAYKETKGIKNRLKYWWLFWRVFRLCDGFISTNKYLDRKYGWIAKKSFVFSNYCDISHWIRPYKGNTTEDIRLLWAGSTSHTGDLQMIQPVIRRIMDKYPQVKFIYIGHGGIQSDNLQAKFIYGEDIFNDLGGKRESLLSVPANIYPHILASLQADIAIAPLEKNYFNKFKSQCKFLEYAINKIPTVYSKWFYTDAIGLKADTQDEWFIAISYLIENYSERKEMARNAYDEVLNKYDIRLYINKYINFIDEI